MQRAFDIYRHNVAEITRLLQTFAPRIKHSISGAPRTLQVVTVEGDEPYFSAAIHELTILMQRQQADDSW
jgi:hypothetical protein